MAKLCFLCSSLCTYLIILLRINKISSSNEYYLYTTDSAHHRSEHSVTLELLDNDESHTYHKRDISIPNANYDPKNSSVLLPNITSEEVTQRHKVFKLEKQEKIPQMNKSVELPALLTTQKYPKNLGVNGAGQRKNITILHSIHDKSVNESEETDSNILHADVQEAVINKTLAEHNVTGFKTDLYEYYNSTFYLDPQTYCHYLVDMSKRTDVKIHEFLSRSHRKAVTVQLSFDFPFYGHVIKNVTIATGGFLYTGESVHPWLAATQYIAPLMANFDTSISNDSFIKYVDNGTAFTVEWEKVSLKETPNDGKFTFQVTLYKNGDIVFVYEGIPFPIKYIKDDQHPVKVGLSDAYIKDSSLYFIRRKTIYEYHRLNISRNDIKNWTIIYLQALPTCLDNHNCSSCVSELQTLKCVWCANLSRCSSGVDRSRHQWLVNRCQFRNISEESMCSHVDSVHTYDAEFTIANHDLFGQVEDDSKVYKDAIMRVRQPDEQMGVSGILAILFLIGMVCALFAWVFYAYRNPHTTSGQILIRYRPSQWRFRRGEARYTAATIHM